MGTSSIYKGPKDVKKSQSTPQASDQTFPTDWRTLKTIFTKFMKSRSGGKSTSISVSGISKLYIKNNGGTSNLVSKSRNAIISTSRLYAFLSSASENGLSSAIIELGINIEGLSTYETLSALSSVFTPDASSKEDSVLRHASIEAMSAFYDYMERNNLDIVNFDKPTGATKKMLIEIFITEYIIGLVMKDLFSKFEQYKQEEEDIVAIEKEFKDFIQSKVDVELASFIDENELSQKDLEQKVTNLYSDIFDILGGEK